MLILYAALIACIVVLRLWPDVPMARAVDALVVTPVARRHAGLTPGHWVLFTVVAAVVGTALWVGGDLLVALSFGSPEIAGALALLDIAYVDALLVAIATAGSVRLAPARQWLGRMLPRPRRRSRRARRPRPARKAAANDDDPAPMRRAA